MSTVINVGVESEPHNEDLSNVLLNRPAPSDGAFIIYQRIPRPLWDKMKSAGAWYYSADDLEELDMFNVAPGWRYNISALRVLLENGYTLTVRGEDVTTVEQLDAMFMPEAIEAYWQRVKDERNEKKRQAELTARREAEEREAERQAYEVWKAEHLTGLVKTFANDDRDQSGVEWKSVAHFGGAGSWHTTGDSWHVAVIDGHTCYKCYYGNAVVSYVPQHIVDRWCEAHWQKRVEAYKGDAAAAARKVLVDSLHEYIGADIAKRLVEIHGADHFVKLATATEWWIFGENKLGWESNAAAHYGAPYVRLQGIPMGTIMYTARYSIAHGLVQSYWYHPDGRIIAKAYYEHEWAVVDPAELPQPVQQAIRNFQPKVESEVAVPTKSTGPSLSTTFNDFFGE